MTYKLGSLFDGSGGFPLAGALCGVTPTWAAEVEPYPIAVTRSRFPDMRHLGDISKVSGAEIEPVDIITFGSPCQDLSVAGKRAGLKHEVNGDDETTRSGLFMEAVRIIKEMREATNGEYPRFALWENVPGAFSSNKGEDFRVVLAELIRIVEPGAVMPPVPKAGWNYADDYRGDGWSLAYRVFDAQYWGVPQRRRRIHLVVDFRGERAREVLFEREGVRGYFEKGRTPWQGLAPDAEEGSGAADREGESDGGLGGHGGRQLDAVAYISNLCIVDSIGGNAERGWVGDVAPCLKASHYKFPPVITHAAGFKAGQSSGGIAWSEECAASLTAESSGTEPSVCVGVSGFCPEQSAKIRGIGYAEEQSPTLRAGVVPAVVKPIPIHDQATRFSGKRGDKADGKGNGLGVGAEGDPMNTLTAGDRHAVAYATDIGFFSSYEEKSPTLLARGYKDPHLVTFSGSEVEYIVRRLTPTECARLQGFADRWGDIDGKKSFTPEEFQFWLDVRNTHAGINGRAVKDYTEAQMLSWYNKLHTDAAEYKMWGNGIALPPALYCLQGMVDALNAAEVDDSWML